MIRTVSNASLGGYNGPGIVVRDHFRKVPENAGGPHYGLGPLRTLAETTIEADCGFPMHGHRDFEIISYVCEGALGHEDTLGNRGRLEAGDMQVMTTGTGVRHSETNVGATTVRMYQLWIEPAEMGLAPDYVDVPQPKGGVAGALRVLASGRADLTGGAYFNQDAAILGADLAAGQSVQHRIDPGRHTYVLAASGRLGLNGVDLPGRDGAVVEDETTVEITAREDAEVLILDLPRSANAA